jgi:hypothetical protein
MQFLRHAIPPGEVRSAGDEVARELLQYQKGRDRSRPVPTAGFQRETRQFRYDLALLSFISIFVLMTAVFVVYTNTKNMKQVEQLISAESGKAGKASFAATAARGNGEMASRKWKVLTGTFPVFSSGETGEEKKSKEL